MNSHICSRLGYLQSQINKAKISTFMEAHKTLHEAKLHSCLTIKIQPISIEHLKFTAFSDASFASPKVQDSHQGMIIMSCHKDLGINRTSVVYNLVAFQENPDSSSEYSFRRSYGTGRSRKYVVMAPSLLGLDNQD